MVTVTLEAVCNSYGETTHWVVATTTGYRAIFPVCPCDRIPCTRKGGHRVPADPAEVAKYRSKRYAARYAREQHEWTHCHGLHGRHREQAEKFAANVARTYPARRAMVRNDA